LTSLSRRLSAFLDLHARCTSGQKPAIRKREVSHVEVAGLVDFVACEAQERQHADDPEYVRDIDSLIVRTS
jgi:hypothetical protein